MQELLADATWPQVGIVVAVISGVAAVGGWVVRRFLPFLRNLGHFFDDWFGEAERPGVERRPGVPEQLATMRHEQVKVAAELKFNGGESVKDVTNQTRAAVAKLASDVADMASRADLEQLGRRVDNLAAVVGGRAVVEQASQLASHQEGASLWQAISDVAANASNEE